MFINKNKIVKGVTILSACFFITSCQKIQEFGDTNVNPNGPTTVNTGALLTNVEANIGAITSGLVPGLFSQYFTEATYPGNGLYSIPNFSSAATYRGMLMDCQKIITFNSDPATAGVAAANGDNGNQIHIAKILKGYLFWTITDRWGDVPYSEALQGATVLTPKYDAQLSIYQSIIADLTAAATGLNEGVAPIKGDVVYSGSIAKWKKLANSMRMLMSLRLSERFPVLQSMRLLNLRKHLTMVVDILV